MVFSNQKTSLFIQSIQAEQVDISVVYNRKDWLIRVAALFYLYINFLWLIQQIYYRNIEQQDTSILYYNINFWGRKNIPADRAAFQVLEELVLHSFDARVVGLLYTCLEQYSINISEQDKVDQAIQDINTQGFTDLVENICRSAFEPQAWQLSKEKYTNNTVDKEFLSYT